MKFIASILVFIVYVLFEIGLITYKPVLILNLLLILSLGLLHGSNDLAIYKQVTGTKWKFLMINYGIVALIFILSYLIAPLLCLILFVLVSAYHFGQELYEAEGLKSTLIENLILGILIFLLMFTFNVEEFNQVFDNLTSFQVSEITLVILSVCFSVAHLILMAVKIKKTGESTRVLAAQLISLSFLGTLFYALDLFTSFTIFFVFWHSLPSLRNQMKHLYNKPKSWSRYLKDAAPIYLVSLIGIVMSYFLFFGKNYFQQFALLAAIIVTVPHIIIIHKLYGGKKIASITKNTL